MLLQQILDMDLVNFVRTDNWQEAIKLGCAKIVEHGFAKEGYAQDIIDNVNQFGPYIVLIENVAIPHCQENSQNALKTCVAFTSLGNPVNFEAKNESKQAKLLFTLVSTNPTEHQKNLGELVEIFDNENLLKDLMKISNKEDFRRIIEQYN